MSSTVRSSLCFRVNMLWRENGYVQLSPWNVLFVHLVACFSNWRAYAARFTFSTSVPPTTSGAQALADTPTPNHSYGWSSVTATTQRGRSNKIGGEFRRRYKLT